MLLPQTDSDDFYTASARAAVAPVYQPFLKALPLPLPNAPLIDPTCDNITNPCEANLTVAYSDPSFLNATSIRVDHNLSKKITLFARYNHAPSYESTRYWKEVRFQNSNTDTITVGATILVAPSKVNDFRANWSRNAATFIDDLTNFHGGVVPPGSALYPSSSPVRLDLTSVLFSLGDMDVREGTRNDNVQNQLNFVDTFSWVFGLHQLKFGIDYRQLSVTEVGTTGYSIFPSYTDMLSGTMSAISLGTDDPPSVRANNYSLFAQDTWRATNRLTLTYGLRWEINTPPVSMTADKPLYVIQGIFDSNAIAAVPGPLWHTQFNNFAPRIGAAYQINSNTVVRRVVASTMILATAMSAPVPWGFHTEAVISFLSPRQCLSICRIQLSSFHRSRRPLMRTLFIYTLSTHTCACRILYSGMSPLSGNWEPGRC